MSEDLVIGMAGAGGDGVISAGESLIAAAARGGYHAMMTKSFGSQIRGGESSCRVRVACRPVLNQGGTLDVAVALNWDDFLRFGAELPVGGETIVVYEARSGVAPDRLPLAGVKPAEAIPVPFTELSKSSAGSDRAKNAVVLGLLAEWFGLAGEAILAGIRKRLARKGTEILEATERAFEAGAGFARSRPLACARHLAPALASAGGKLLLDGNEMCAAAAIFAGCDFFGGYPITPSTEIMQYLTRELWGHGGAVLQAEDEIAGIGSALGASFAGKKAMTATSGPGMSLKTEVLGLATIAELPLVIVNVQRGGPSTGMPTKSEQADLFQAVFSAHGDVMRPVLAPTSVADTFATTVEAFNLAEEYQTPVVMLSDQELAQRKETVDPIDTTKFRLIERLEPASDDSGEYERFRLTPSGVSPLSHPGVPGGNYLGAGIEHNESGAPTASGAVHARMTEKRFHKFDPLLRRADLFQVEGDPRAPLALLSWGSSAGVCREARVLAEAQGLHVKLLIPYLLYPIAAEVYASFFRGVIGGLVVEQSFQGQLYRLLRMQLDLPAGLVPFARPGANPFQPREIVNRLRQLSRDIQGRESHSHRPQE